jgi:hypothetical protein
MVVKIRPARMKPRDALTAERVRDLFEYFPESGEFRRKRARKNAASAKSRSGYPIVTVDGHTHFAHRLIWLFVTGAWPIGAIDHRNENKADNRWVNLRDVSSAHNAHNRRTANLNNAAGLLGAHFHRGSGRYRARIRVNGRQLHLGEFDTAEEAHAVYLRAKRDLHPGFDECPPAALNSFSSRGASHGSHLCLSEPRKATQSFSEALRG